MKHSDRFSLGRSRLNRVLMAAILAFAGACPSGARQVHETVGWRPTMIPLLNFSSDDGTGYGLRANLFEYDGQSVPYRRKYSAQVFITTKGKWVHRVLVDTPEIPDRPAARGRTGL